MGIKIYYDESGLRTIMGGDKIAKVEDEIMASKLSQIENEFLQTFGFAGHFEIKAVMTKSRRSRIAYRIVATDARTTAALKRQPGWLAKFL